MAAAKPLRQPVMADGGSRCAAAREILDRILEYLSVDVLSFGD